jgi:hypothetical protein
VTKLKEFLARQKDTKRASTTKKAATARSMREDTGEVRVVRSLGLDAASVALPANVDLEVRAARMNDFWKALVEFQYRDVLVVAICADIES